MTITEATWERRNFGMDAYEITLDKKDCENEAEILAQIRARNFKNAYVCVKMPVGNLKALHALEDEGFRFLETQFRLMDNFEPKDFGLEAVLKNSNYKISFEILPKKEDEWEKIISQITPGMFDTDRISLDPKLGFEISCKRYQNWCRDLFKNPNSYMLVRKVNDEIYSFSVEIKDEKTKSVDSVLGGVFEKYKSFGLGATWTQTKHYDQFKVKTSVSSNNFPVLRIHQHAGRVIYKEEYVLRKIY